MSAYHLHARYFVGPTSAPQHDETRRSESDDLAALRAEAAELVAAGFTVWLFRQDRTRFRSALRLVETLRPTTPPTSTPPVPVRRSRQT